MINSLWLDAFRVLVDMQSYTQAAEQLDLTQPAVSQRIRHLEQYFGTELVRYTHRKVEPTEAGRQVYDLARRFEIQTEEARHRVEEICRRSEALVTVAGPPSLLTRYLPLILQRTWQLYPDTSIRTLQCRAADVSDIVLRGQADLGVTLNPYLDQRLLSTYCFSASMWAICSPRHPLARREAVSPAEIQTQRVALLPSDTYTGRTIEQQFVERNLSLDNRLELSTQEEIRIAALNYQAIGITSDWFVREDIEAGTLCRLNVEGLSIEHNIYAVSSPHPSPASAHLIAVISDAARDPDLWLEKGAGRQPSIS